MNIANKIDAKDKKLGEILNCQRYKIDVFQRDYRWGYVHIEALISDLTSNFYKSYRTNHTIEDYVSYDCYYMGPIVLCEDVKGDLSIIDGQQRLTSFTLLMIYLSHQQKLLNIDEDSQKDFDKYFYVKKGGKRSLVLDVQGRSGVMEALIKDPKEANNDEKLNMSDPSVQNILARYDDIVSLFPPEICTVEVLPLFIEWLLEKVVLVEVKAYSNESAYTIFETMNDRGLSLNSTEILKGYLLSKIVDNHPENEGKAEDANNFWNDRIQQMKTITRSDLCDAEFFRAWLRGSYAESKRSNKPGAENEDFENIGKQYHTWVKNNPQKLRLRKTDDYYFFIRSEFDFFSSLYLKIYKYKTQQTAGRELMYINNFFPIADSLSYPLLISPISRLDDSHKMEAKLMLTISYIDCYSNIRMMQHKTITQSTIRDALFENVKAVRNMRVEELATYYQGEFIRLIKNADPFKTLQPMYNWGYGHYFLARIRYHIKPTGDFSEMMRSRKQSSYILCILFDGDDWKDVDEEIKLMHSECVGNHFLIRRKDYYDYRNLKTVQSKIDYLVRNNCLPELDGKKVEADMIELIRQRDKRLMEIASELWSSKMNTIE